MKRSSTSLARGRANQTTVSYHLAPTRRPRKSRRPVTVPLRTLQAGSVARCRGVRNGVASWDKSSAADQTHGYHTSQPFHFWGYLQKKQHDAHRKHSHTVAAALLTRASSGNNQRSTCRWRGGRNLEHRSGTLFANKQKQSLRDATTAANLEHRMPSERSPWQKPTYCMIPHLWPVPKRQIHPERK